MPQNSWTISIDTGGTFTDSVARAQDGNFMVAKVPSTPSDPGLALVHSIQALVNQGLDPTDINLICHGTTIATNAILTNQFSKVALVVTSGFKDVLAIRNGIRPDIYNLHVPRPAQLVDREHCVEVVERVTTGGKVLTSLTDGEIDRVIEELVKIEPESIAICLLFSYSNDKHESMLAEKIRKSFPGIPVTVSSEIIREFREYPRTSTAVINAGLRPIVGSYLESVQSKIEESGVTAPFLVMQSNGGCAAAIRSAQESHRLILSGPAGGAAGLVTLGRQHDLDKLIGLDMGGTSSDICLIKDGTLPLKSTQVINDHTLLAPTVDIHTIGAGGGSIAFVDSTGRLKVGPMSAKAVPGPAAYLKGGTLATLTDAHVVLGTIGQQSLASGLTLDKAAAVKAVSDIASKLGQDVVQTAIAIVSISVAHMIRALRQVSIERGLDPRDFTLVPFGGAGPLHAGLLLRNLNLESALIPNRPGLFSAEGLLSAGVRIDAAQTLLSPFSENEIPKYVNWFNEKQEELRERLLLDGISPNLIEFDFVIDARYLGQGYELPVKLLPTLGNVNELPDLFHSAHKALYGHANLDQPIEVVTLRLSARGSFPELDLVKIEQGSKSVVSEARLGIQSVIFPDFPSGVDTAIYQREKLLAGNVFYGPCIVHQMDSTTVVLPGQVVTVTALGDLLIKEEKS
jgi:N-methylhydantoinase A